MAVCFEGEGKNPPSAFGVAAGALRAERWRQTTTHFQLTQRSKRLHGLQFCSQKYLYLLA
jgi:hypothetical protein